MKLVISPAKSLDFESKLPTTKATESLFLEQSKKLNTVLKKQTPQDLSKLMSISDKLAQLNYQRNQDWTLPFTKDNARPAIYSFNGDVYKGLDAYNIPDDKLELTQNTVRILSGLYGVLKPLDLIQPYRLEMGTKLTVGSNKNLYEFWKKDIVKALNEALEEDELFLNLASNEYFKAVDTKALKVPVVTANFKEFKNGKLKIISFYAKEARGLMAKYVIDTNAKTIDDLKQFNYNNYQFDGNLSTEKDLVFTR
ncbi:MULTISPECIES: peroxide stress protein YaaA [unclassified Olleya]|uniref:peroxide stress protein YaaA n=1 Tax=unclassified Olleya TaxID=2615019 RepID=UPI000C315199|nr:MULTISPECIES: peroxide stress protein YaaA [unclassified Olleya]AUC77637.1 peroxide stress protein YaaA [Olleya sp. Bg11-27]QXP60000.1 peroxide stress protein YaaA [Olleya sp. HaHaR_3_96]